VRAFNLDRLQFICLDLDIASLAEFVTPAFLVAFDDPPGVLIDHLLPQAVARLLVDLMKVGLLGLGRGGKQFDRARH
jgi:hypothetical protein